MFVPSTIENRLDRLGIAGIGRDRRRAHRRSGDTRARFRLEGLEERCLLSSISGYNEYPLTSPSAAPTGIVAGPDGNIWFIENSANKIGMVNPTTHATSEFPIPTANSNPWGIAVGPDGNIWFTERGSGKVGVINTITHAVSEYSSSPESAPIGITAGPDGNIWFAGGSGIGVLNLTTHAVTEFPKPSGFLNEPMWITAGPDGNLWFTGASSRTIGRINPTTHVMTVFDAPGTSSGYADAYHIMPGPDGNVWFTDYNGNAIGEINLTTDAITEYPVPTAKSNVYGITLGPDGNLWFTEAAAGQIGSINPATDAISEYPIDDGLNQIAAGPDGNLWFTDYANNAIGVATLTTSQLVVTQQPPPSVTAGSLFGLTVDAEDSSGNPITSFDGTVTVALANNPGGATLGGMLTATASNGIATFSGLTLTKTASGYTLEASGGGLGWGVTNSITVTPAAAAQLVITQQPPATVKVNSGFGLQASIEDQYGNVVTTAGNTVSMALASNPTGATLSGTFSILASQGVVAFSGLKINKVGSGYTLRVSSSGLSTAVTSAINVTKNGASGAIVAASAASAPDLLMAPLVLDSPGFLDSLGLKKRPSL